MKPGDFVHIEDGEVKKSKPDQPSAGMIIKTSDEPEESESISPSE